MSKYGPQIRPAGTRGDAPIVPWGSEAAWYQANLTMQHLCSRHHAELGAARQTAGDLKSRLETLFPVLDDLCVRTCADCQAPCCHVATIWFDFKDLVFMHLNNLAISTEQLSRTPEGVCCCCGPTGCHLPRLSRPWTCSWYLCPVQKNLLAGVPGKTLVTFEETVAAIKGLRKRLEAQFIRITS